MQAPCSESRRLLLPSPRPARAGASGPGRDAAWGGSASPRADAAGNGGASAASAGKMNYMPGTASLIQDIDKKHLVLLRDGRTLIGYLCSIDQFASGKMGKASFLNTMGE